WLDHLPFDPRPKLPLNVQQIAWDILENGSGQKAISKLLGEVLERPSKEIYAELMKREKE
ncbi:MAG: hypothetical protein K2P81_15345, partial [Bacteriovoracaceae bacterium]|nr:hypothetical protein [Bacteriovoracaceae bacterium]